MYALTKYDVPRAGIKPLGFAWFELYARDASGGFWSTVLMGHEAWQATPHKGKAVNGSTEWRQDHMALFVLATLYPDRFQWWTAELPDELTEDGFVSRSIFDYFPQWTHLLASVHP
jgi:hypothetical protein